MIKTLLISVFLLGFMLIVSSGNFTINCLAANDGHSTESPYAGQWNGTWTAKAKIYDVELGETNLSQTGKWFLSIDANGKVTGKETNNVNNNTADLSGSVDEEGTFKLILEYPNETSVVKGTVIKTKAGHLKGTLSQHSKVIWTIEIDLLPK